MNEIPSAQNANTPDSAPTDAPQRTTPFRGGAPAKSPTSAPREAPSAAEQSQGRPVRLQHDHALERRRGWVAFLSLGVLTIAGGGAVFAAMGGRQSWTGVFEKISWEKFDAHYAVVLGLVAALGTLVFLHLSCMWTRHGIDWTGQLHQMIKSAALTMLLVGVVVGLVGGAFLPGYAEYRLDSSPVPAAATVDTITITVPGEGEKGFGALSVRVIAPGRENDEGALVEGATGNEFRDALEGRVRFLKEQHRGATKLWVQHQGELSLGFRKHFSEVAEKFGLELVVGELVKQVGRGETP